MGLPRVQGGLEPFVDRDERGAGGKELGDTDLFELGDIGDGDDSTAEHHHFIESPLPEELEDTGKERHVRAGEQREADGIGIFLQGGLGDLLRRLVQTGVDHLEAAVSEGAGDDLGTAVVTVQTRFGDDHSIPTLHAARTLAVTDRDCAQRDRRFLGRARSVWMGFRVRPGFGSAARLDSRLRGDYTLTMARSANQRQSDLRLLLGTTVAVLLGGIVIAAAILAITADGVPNLRRPQPFGLAVDLRKKVNEGGPLLIAGLSGDDGFWITMENERLVPLLVRQRTPEPCILRWRGSKDTFTCDDRPVDPSTMARYRTSVAENGPAKGLYMVELRKVLPAPAGAPSGGD